MCSIEWAPAALPRLLPLADFAHALIEVELLESLACAFGLPLALPGHRAEAAGDRLHKSAARPGLGRHDAGRRPAVAGGESHGVLLLGALSGGE